MIVVLADHSMDWSQPDRVVSLTAPLAADPMLSGQVQIAQNGGADLLYWTGPEDQRAAAVLRMREVSSRVPGVLSTHETDDKDLRLGPVAGDVIVYCMAGWRFSDPVPATSNPIPGNHGHPATEPIPFFIAGGSPLVQTGTTSSAPVRTVDVAPTVGRVFGLPPPSGGYDGRSRL
jgi:arylsulfatase A-like enzyme